MEFDRLFHKKKAHIRPKEKCKCESNNKTSENMWTIEFQRGDSMTYNEISNNMIYTGKYSILNFFPKTLFYYLQRVGNLYYLIISLLMILSSPENSPFQSWIFMFQLLFFFSVYWIKELYIEIKKTAPDRLVNNRGVFRGTKGGEGDFDKVSWRELKMGDIVVVNCGEIIPADLILLDSSDIVDRQAVCFLDSRDFDGKLDIDKKKASSLTQIITKNPRKGVFKEYRRILNGKIEYESPNPNIDTFKGYLKLKKDPKIEKLSIENLVPRGGKLFQTKWIFGIVVYSGLETKIVLNSEYGKKRQNFLTQLYNTIPSSRFSSF